MSRSWIVAALLVAAACSDDAVDVAWQELDGLDYAVPLGWAVRDQSEQMRKVSVWSPEVNPRKETVTVMRTRPLEGLTKVGLPRMQPLLASALDVLPKGTFTKPERVVTPKGMVGLRVDGTFVPTGMTVPYQRIHVVMLDGTSLIHVMYTAKQASREPEALDVVLASMHRGEA